MVQVLPGVCTDQIHHTRSRHSKEMTTARWSKIEGYQMVIASICDHASSAFIIASTSSDQFSHASSEHLVDFPPAGISLYWNVVLRQVIWLTLSKQDNRYRARQHDSDLIVVQPFPVAYSQLCRLRKITSLSFTRVSGWTLNGIRSFLMSCSQTSRFPLKRVKKR